MLEKMGFEKIMEIAYANVCVNNGWFNSLDLSNTPIRASIDVPATVIRLIESKLTQDQVQDFCNCWNAWEKRQRKSFTNPAGMFIHKLKEYANNGNTDVRVVAKVPRKEDKPYVEPPQTGFNFTDEQKAEFEVWWSTATNEDKEAIFPLHRGLFGNDYNHLIYKLGVRGVKVCADMGVDWLGNKLNV